MKNYTSLQNHIPIPGSMRIFWKIIMDAQGDTLRAVKELSLWGEAYRKDPAGKIINIDGSEAEVNPQSGQLVDPAFAARLRHRYMWKQIPLQVEVGPEVKDFEHRDQKKISVEDGIIFFHDGYLKIHDTSLVEDLRVWGKELDATAEESIPTVDQAKVKKTADIINPYLDSLKAISLKEDHSPKESQEENYPEQVKGGDDHTLYFQGYNVRLEVDMALADSIVENNKPVAKTHPVFYYPQEPDQTKPPIGAISLTVDKFEDKHALVWKISDLDTILPPEHQIDAYYPRPYHLEELHSVTVNQESIDSDTAQFAFLADTIPLPPDELAPGLSRGIEEAFIGPAGHKFSKLGRFFYVGYSPESKEIFQGYIRRLVFDPNSSCYGC